MAIVTMILGKQVVESRVFPNSHLLINGYLQGLKQDMLEQNDDLVKQQEAVPKFEVEITPKKIVIRN
jgi:hypothetical protein